MSVAEKMPIFEPLRNGSNESKRIINKDDEINTITEKLSKQIARLSENK